MKILKFPNKDNPIRHTESPYPHILKGLIAYRVRGMEQRESELKLKIGIMKDLYGQGHITESQMKKAIENLTQAGNKKSSFNEVYENVSSF
jgi:hypothetical protein